MLSSVLKSEVAIQVNISIMRVFVQIRKRAINYDDLLEKIKELELSQNEQNQHISRIYRTIEELLKPHFQTSKRIGFVLLNPHTLYGVISFCL